ncbi:MAG: RcpC/CpaB family pilus assembly protein [Acidimicrobiia bacterium]|nr:RcpC/CpaB family pilus assembly protein [Acidimicrobiia bacterium]
MNKRLLSLAASVALAAIGTFVLLSYVQGADERAAEGEESVEVLVVEETIPRGTPIEDVDGSVGLALVPAKVQAIGSLASLDDLSGTVAAVDLQPGEQLLSSRFIEPTLLVAATRVDIPEGLLEVTFELDPERIVGGQPIPGDLVAVVASFDPIVLDSVEPGDSGISPGTDANGLRTASSTHIILHKVLLTNLQVQAAATRATNSDDETDTVDIAPAGRILATLALSAPDLEKAVFAAEHGRIWLAREGADTPEAGTVIQTRETIYR